MNRNKSVQISTAELISAAKQNPCPNSRARIPVRIDPANQLIVASSTPYTASFLNFYKQDLVNEAVHFSSQNEEDPLWFNTIPPGISGYISRHQSRDFQIANR
ncbi:hypothetical protein CISG_02592 [Coccidioides immitis RMSCC 3703]|uniref:Uncharacterized protein n=1 Tax=Coccidioides immitis RMSCC 3703 TaxID=454286 RepID=A0A0J8R871_COCIT|nr:hypothetical protein CISG_02592 [Coccidioides immitis RMSCC 3703]